MTAQSGMDAITQCLEPLTSRFANPMVDALALAGLRAGAESLVRAVEHGDDVDARTGMALCSLMGGLSLANAKLGAVHGLAGVLGGITGAPHGAICAALLGPVTAANLAAMAAREPENPAGEAYAVGAEALTGRRAHGPLLGWLDDVQARLALPGLGAFGLARGEHDAVVAAAAASSSMQGNPVRLTQKELRGILLAAQ